MMTGKRAPWWVWPLLLLFLPLVAVAFVLWLAAATLLQLIVWTVWCSRGRYALVVYSNSPLWQEYFETQVVPRLGGRAVVLNWSERNGWKMTLPVILFRVFAGTREFNPIAIVFEPLAWPRRFRFYQAFRSLKRGKPEEVETLRLDLFRLLDELARTTPASPR